MKKEYYFNSNNIKQVAFDLKKSLKNLGLDKFKYFKTPHKALIVLDMQNYFLMESSHAFVPSSYAIINNINKLIDHFQKNNLLIIFTKHSNNLENAKQMLFRFRNLTPEKGIFNDIFEKINSRHGIIIEKTQYDAFYNTDLKKILIDNNIKQVILTGVIANLCVETTARAAFVHGFNTIVPLDATATYNYELHLASMTNIAFAINSPPTTNELLDILGKE